MATLPNVPTDMLAGTRGSYWNGAQVFYWNGAGQTVYGTVQQVLQAADGTITLNIKLDESRTHLRHFVTSLKSAKV
ncbi:hypothetical protein B0H10DRAFT_2197141, partial [Mycena sp. CBHHK59/15]